MKIKIAGTDGVYDGEWELDTSFFTNRERHKIKQISGVRMFEVGEAFEKGDSALYIAFAVIALERAGKYVDLDVLWDANDPPSPVGDEQEEDARPPELKARTPDGGDNYESAASPTSSGDSSGSDSASPETSPNGSGTEYSASVTSGPEMSAT